MTLEVQIAIQVRVEVLNYLLAEEISENSQYGRPYEKWIQNVFEDKQRVMNNNRLSFKASHPKFIQYFEDLNLTEKEINYVCLYAIGLKGKEVGAYMQLKSHVNMSSAIRKKLGIYKYETTIGIYVSHIYTTDQLKQ